jgi:anti-sigma factor RsiW
MTHPTREEWMSYLYDELPAKRHASLQTHLQSCAECRAQVAVWQSAARELSGWKIPRRRKTPRTAVLTRWAMAAAIVALAVVGGERIFTLSNEVKNLRAEVQRGAKRNIDAAMAEAVERATRSANVEVQALIAAVVQQWEQKRLADQQATIGALQKISTRYAQDYAALRKELETVAVFSEAGWQRTQNQISSLVATPASFSNDQ